MRNIWAKSIVGTIAVTLLLAGVTNAAVQQKSPYKKYYNKQYSNQRLLAEETEIKVGELLHKKLTEQMRFVDDPVLNKYVSQIGMKLAQQSARPSLQYQFFIIEDQTVNAFATMGGYVYVNSGLLLQLTNEAQLAAVLAHEIGHIAARHGPRKMKPKWGPILLATLGGAAPFSNQIVAALSRTAAQMAAKGVVMKYSRDNENEADYLGLVSLRNAGYTTRGMVEMLQTLQEMSANRPSLLKAIMASHPPAKDRVENTQKEIALHLSDQQGVVGKAGSEFVKLRERVNGITPPSGNTQAATTAKRTKKKKRRN